MGTLCGQNNRHHRRLTIKILIYTHEFAPWSGGIATYNLELAHGLKDKGHDVLVLAPKYSDDRSTYHSKSYRVWRSFPNNGFKPYKILASIVGFVMALILYRPDVILATSGGAHRCLAFLTLLIPVQYVLVIHGSEIINDFDNGRHSKLRRGVIRRVFRNAKGIIAVSKSTKKLILSKMPELAKKVFVVYHGISVPYVKHKEQQEINELKSSIGLGNEDKILLTVARLAPGKGQDNVIRALPRVLKKIPNVKYVVVGSGRCEGELKALTKTEGISSVVRFVDNVERDKIWLYYEMCDVFIMTSRRGNKESFGISFIEAAAVGKTAIGGRQGGMTEVIDDGVSGILVNPDSPNDIANAIINIFACPETSARMGEQARKRFEANFSAQIMVEETLKVVAQLV